MGRPRKTDDEPTRSPEVMVMVPCRMPAELRDTIDTIVGLSGRTRSDVIRTLLADGCRRTLAAPRAAGLLRDQYQTASAAEGDQDDG